MRGMRFISVVLGAFLLAACGDGSSSGPGGNGGSGGALPAPECHDPCEPGRCGIWEDECGAAYTCGDTCADGLSCSASNEGFCQCAPFALAARQDYLHVLCTTFEPMSAVCGVWAPPVVAAECGAYAQDSEPPLTSCAYLGAVQAPPDDSVVDAWCCCD